MFPDGSLDFVPAPRSPVMDNRLHQRVPAVLITGFLGSGKTTLLKRWLSDAPATGRRLGIIINDFGRENIDEQILGRPDLPMVAVEGGCVCCATDNELERACSQLVRSQSCDVILIETSGLADPDGVIDILTDPDILGRVQLQAVVSVVDAQWWAGLEDGADPAERVLAKKQIQFAQVIALSKCDTLSETDRDRVAIHIQEMNPRAQIVRLPFCLPDLMAILDATPASVVLEMAIDASPPPSTAEVEGARHMDGTRSVDRAYQSSTVSGQSSDDRLQASATEGATTSSMTNPSHLHHRYQSVSWRFPVPIDRGSLEKFLRELNPREVVRAKGFVRFTQDPDKMFLFQSVFGHVFLEEFPAWPYPEPIGVFIGPNLDATHFQSRLRTLVFGTQKRTLTLGT